MFLRQPWRDYAFFLFFRATVVIIYATLLQFSGGRVAGDQSAANDKQSVGMHGSPPKYG